MITVPLKQLLRDNVLKETFDLFETFEEYWQRITFLREEGKTTGAIQTPEMIHYSEMSYVRMNRILKHAKLSNTLIESALKTRATNWLIITEAWCGDASNTVPLMVKAAQQNTSIKVRIMVRDEHPELMENYLTNGGKSIPILVLFNDQFEELTFWGPRPKPCQELFLSLKTQPNLNKEDVILAVQEWYAKDKGQTFQSELTQLLKTV
jgi:hypothetical protein